MRANLIIVVLIGLEQMTKMLLAEHDDMVKAVPPDRTDEPLRVSVLPWRARRDRSVSNAVGSKN